MKFHMCKAEETTERLFGRLSWQYFSGTDYLKAGIKEHGCYTLDILLPKCRSQKMEHWSLFAIGYWQEFCVMDLK